jgi:hypothetical protein
MHCQRGVMRRVVVKSREQQADSDGSSAELGKSFGDEVRSDCSRAWRLRASLCWMRAAAAVSTHISSYPATKTLITRPM